MAGVTFTSEGTIWFFDIFFSENQKLLGNSLESVKITIVSKPNMSEIAILL